MTEQDFIKALNAKTDEMLIPHYKQAEEFADGLVKSIKKESLEPKEVTFAMMRMLIEKGMPREVVIEANMFRLIHALTYTCSKLAKTDQVLTTTE